MVGSWVRRPNETIVPVVEGWQKAYVIGIYYCKARLRPKGKDSSNFVVCEYFAEEYRCVWAGMLSKLCKK